MKTEFIGNPTSSPNIPVTANATTSADYEGSFSYTSDDFNQWAKRNGITFGGDPHMGKTWWGDPPPMPAIPPIPSIPITPFSGHCSCCHLHPIVTVTTSTRGLSIIPERSRAYSNPTFAGKRKRQPRS
jgi:hypothetical protein